jgi:CDP-diacylglycerol--serine O-phosphatidyltransferase
MAAPTRPPLHKGAYIFPNLLTAGNVFAGFYSIVATMNLRFDSAAIAIVVAAFMDGLDGKVARFTGGSSRFGVEFDSLADLVSFGVAPALLMYQLELKAYGRFGWVACFLFVACGALRLARFNVQSTSTEKRWFTGLPIPMAALTLAATVLFFRHLRAEGREHTGLLFVLLVYLLSFLMVSTFKYRSFKELETRPHRSFYFLVTVVIVISLIAIHPPIALFSLAGLYLFSGPIEPILALVLRRRKGKRLWPRVPEDGRRPPLTREKSGEAKP